MRPFLSTGTGMTDLPDNHGTLVERLHGRIARLCRETSGDLPDGEMARRLAELFEATSGLAHARAGSISELELKLDILCRRLREDLDPDNRGQVLTWLLAESIRDDLRLAR